MLKKILLALLILSTWICPGCWDYREIEQSSVPAAVGVDLDNDQQIVFSTQLVKPMPPGEAGSSTIQPALISGRSPAVAMAARRIMLSLSQVPEWAHVRTIIFGERLVRRDLSLAVDFMTRNRNLRPDINLLIASSATPEAILSTRLPQGSDLGLGLQELVNLSESQLGIYTPITMEEFTYRLSAPGIEPAVPQVSLAVENKPGTTSLKEGDKKAEQADNKTSLMLDGTAVFKGSKMVGSLNETESRGYRWLRSKHKQGGYFIINSPFGDGETIGFEVRQFDSRTRARITNGQPAIKIEVRALLNLYDQNGTHSVLNDQFGQLEEAAALEIKRQIESCIAKSQALDSDILGWGSMINAYQPDEWEAVESRWGEIYPTIQADIQVKASIRGLGMTGKAFPLR